MTADSRPDPRPAREANLVEQANELAAMWEGLTPEQRLDALLRATLGFAEYAGDTSDEAVIGFATGFVQDAKLPTKMGRLDGFLSAYGVSAP